MKALFIIGTIIWMYLVWNAPAQYAQIKSQGRYNEAERYQELIKKNKILNQK